MNNSEDIIDSRDIIARIEELRGELDPLVSNWQDAAPEDKAEASEDLLEWLGAPAGDFPEDFTGTPDELKEWATSPDAEELRSLESLSEEASGCADWQYGETLIRDTHFEDYARELAADLGSIDREESWPNNCIDWERAARELQQDYMEVDFDGVAYWIRA